MGERENKKKTLTTGRVQLTGQIFELVKQVWAHTNIQTLFSLIQCKEKNMRKHTQSERKRISIYEC